MMKLYFTETSPFSRKVRVAAAELGLAERIATEFLRPAPAKPDPTLSKVNPLSKIPTLILDDGSALYDSGVICEYLDSIHPGKKLISATSTDARFRTLRTHALCDGILEAGVLVFYERMQRPKELHWEAWLDGQTAKVTQGLDALERDVASLRSDADAGIDLAQISVAVTLGWLEFRNAIGPIREGRAQLFAWYDEFKKRPSMITTEYRA